METNMTAVATVNAELGGFVSLASDPTRLPFLSTSVGPEVRNMAHFMGAMLGGVGLSAAVVVAYSALLLR